MNMVGAGRPPSGTRNLKFSNDVARAGKSKVTHVQKSRVGAHKRFDARNFPALIPVYFRAGIVPALLRFVMSTRCTHIAKTDAFVRPFIRLADRSCMSNAKQWSMLRHEAGLIGKTRV